MTKPGPVEQMVARFAHEPTKIPVELFFQQASTVRDLIRYLIDLIDICWDAPIPAFSHNFTSRSYCEPDQVYYPVIEWVYERLRRGSASEADELGVALVAGDREHALLKREEAEGAEAAEEDEAQEEQAREGVASHLLEVTITTEVTITECSATER